MAIKLQIPGANDKDSPILRLVQQRLSSEASGSWFIILDNLDDISVFQQNVDDGPGQSALAEDSQRTTALMNLLPVSAAGSVLITSRSREASTVILGSLGSQSGACLIPVSPMTEEESLNLIKARLPNINTSSSEEAMGLAKDLEQLPLAISQATAYILKGAPLMTISRYRRMLHESESSKIHLLQQSIKDIRRDERPSYAVLFTWNASFDQIQSLHPLSAEMLRAMSLFSHQSIPFSLLEALLEPNQDSDLDSLMLPLLQYHLVFLRPMDESYDLHHFVQLATRMSLKSTSTLTKTSEKALMAVKKALPALTLEKRNYFAKFVPHALEILDCELEQPHELLKIASIALSVANYWRAISLYNKAEDAITRAVHIRAELLGDYDRLTITAQ